MGSSRGRSLGQLEQQCIDRRSLDRAQASPPTLQAIRPIPCCWHQDRRAIEQTQCSLRSVRQCTPCIVVSRHSIDEPTLSQRLTLMAPPLHWYQKIHDLVHDLPSLLIEPIQRIPRYKLMLTVRRQYPTFFLFFFLFSLPVRASHSRVLTTNLSHEQDIIKHTNQEHPDYYNLKEAEQVIEHILAEMNLAAKFSNNRRKILDIEYMFNGDVVRASWRRSVEAFVCLFAQVCNSVWSQLCETEPTRLGRQPTICAECRYSRHHAAPAKGASATGRRANLAVLRSHHHRTAQGGVL